ncbi:HD domain-containing phosphohydrolase [Neptunomonas qingdaonensis]|uniref:Response regulator c-di-GMP phosphodiesterase, RpfG family, contains REC and HD-GYP domains n=1 Tax=Neptunomonas qingdaonensis TaxID=1045558 RepID=A0A1I2RDY6_9GAMM|nr:HD domain-containing phosphohydrolase [Neptunomonas qingdaonensis]SFG38712.1 Response regulator c-di-GMP phosphodiesterase, RpfG family, contains REC and HD-GYP domains [Neptunomonas qingdaonensis]
MENETTENIGYPIPETADKKLKILCVDDEPSVLSSLKRLLRKAAYEVFTANGGETALDLMRIHRIDMIISDMRMPEMSGADLLTQVAQHYPETVRLLLTGYSDIESTIAAVNHGKIDQFIQKPWNNDEILLTIEQELERKQLAEENKALSAQVKAQNDELINLNIELESRIQKRTFQIRQTLLKLEEKNRLTKENNKSTLKVFYNLISMNDHLDGKQALMVSQLCVLIGKHLGYDTAQLYPLKLAGLLNELGLLCMDQALLKCPYSDLSDTQQILYQSHPQQAYTAMAPVAHLSLTASIILHQYERIDGDGLPQHLEGELIPEESRILAVARDFIAATQGKLFQSRLSKQGALEYLTQRAGSTYDAEILEHLPELLYELECDILEQDEIIISSSQLKPNMVLSRDVLSCKDILLLADGHILTTDSIKRLVGFEKTDKQPLTVYIFQPAVSEA